METALYTSLPRDSRIALLASGGVDSSVAMHLLVEAGFRPDLYYIRIGMQDKDGGYLDCPAEEKHPAGNTPRPSLRPAPRDHRPAPSLLGSCGRLYDGCGEARAHAQSRCDVQ